MRHPSSRQEAPRHKGSIHGGILESRHIHTISSSPLKLCLGVGEGVVHLWLQSALNHNDGSYWTGSDPLGRSGSGF